MDQVTLDFSRPERLGFPEAVFAQRKSPGQLEEIVCRLVERNERALFTHLDDVKFLDLPAACQTRLDYDPLSRTAFLGSPKELTGMPRVAVVTAGTSDIPVAQEARRTLDFHGLPSLPVNDVGVAGLHRLLSRLDEIRPMPVIIAVAGMDAALVSVLGGLIGGLIVAVPTSVGYGVAQGGLAALSSALSSCAPGVVVVNIDNGYGAAMAATRVLYKSCAGI